MKITDFEYQKDYILTSKFNFQVTRIDNRLEVINRGFISLKKNIGKVSKLISALKDLSVNSENLQDQSIVKIYQRVFLTTKKATPRLKRELYDFLRANIEVIKNCIYIKNIYICLFLYLHKVHTKSSEKFITGIHQGRHEYIWFLLCTLLNIPYVHRSTFNLRHSSDISEVRKVLFLKGKHLINIL